MNIHDLKLKLSPDQIEKYCNITAQSLMSGHSLSILSDRLGSEFDDRTSFAFASLFCKSEFGESIDEVAPQMVLERMSMNEARREEILLIRKKQAEDKAQKMKAEDMQLYHMEQLARAG